MPEATAATAATAGECSPAVGSARDGSGEGARVSDYGSGGGGHGLEGALDRLADRRDDTLDLGVGDLVDDVTGAAVDQHGPQVGELARDELDRVGGEQVVEELLADVALLEVRVVVVDDLVVLVAEEIGPPDALGDREESQPGDARRRRPGCPRTPRGGSRPARQIRCRRRAGPSDRP